MVVRRVEVLSRPATNVSRMLAVAEMALYALFLVFSLRTHSNLFNGGEQEKRNDQGECNAQEKMTSSKAAAAAAAAANAESGDEDPEVASINRAYMSREFANKKEEEEEDEVVLGTRASLFLAHDPRGAHLMGFEWIGRLDPRALPKVRYVPALHYRHHTTQREQRTRARRGDPPGHQGQG